MACIPAHCSYCFDVLSAQLNGTALPQAKEWADEAFPLFVTWNIKSRSSGNWDSTRLRGCIGNFSAMPLEKGLREYALISALRDTRFSPVTLSDLPKLECGVSLLTDFESCKDAYDWELSKHGVHVYLPTGKGELSATFLPNVAPQQGWNKQDTLEHAITKSGYRGTIDDKLIATLRVERYQSSKATMNYDEWKASKE